MCSVLSDTHVHHHMTGTLYLIYHPQSGCHKIGISENWNQRARQLKVGTATQFITKVNCKNPRKWEKVLHKMFAENRAPGSEYFKVDRQEAIRKFQWVESKISVSRMIVGNWKTNANGDLYRRRKSKNGNWYTEHKNVNLDQLESIAALQTENLIINNDKSYEKVVHPERYKTIEEYNPNRYVMLVASIALMCTMSPLVIIGFVLLLMTIGMWSTTKEVRVGSREYV